MLSCGIIKKSGLRILQILRKEFLSMDPIALTAANFRQRNDQLRDENTSYTLDKWMQKVNESLENAFEGDKEVTSVPIHGEPGEEMPEPIKAQLETAGFSVNRFYDSVTGEAVYLIVVPPDVSDNSEA